MANGDNSDLNFLQQLGVALSIMGAGTGGGHPLALEAFQRNRLVQGHEDELRRKRQQEQALQAAIGQLTGMMGQPVSQPQAPVRVGSPLLEGIGVPPDAAPPTSFPSTSGGISPQDFQRALAQISVAHPELAKVTDNPEWRTTLKELGLLPTGAELTRRTYEQATKGLSPYGPGGESVNVDVEGAKSTISRRPQTTVEGATASNVGLLGKTPSERLGLLTEQKRTPISEQNLQEDINRRISRVGEIDKLLIGGSTSWLDQKAAITLSSKAEGLDKLKLKIERNLLGNDAQAMEIRRAEIARRQGFPNEQPRRLFSSPVLGGKELMDAVTTEFLAHYKIAWKSGTPEFKLPPDVLKAYSAFMRENFGPDYEY